MAGLRICGDGTARNVQAHAATPVFVRPAVHPAANDAKNFHLT